MYFIISQSDGDVHIRTITEQQALEVVNGEGAPKLLVAGSFDPDPNYWEDNEVLLIKGEVVRTTVASKGLTT